MKTQKPVDFTEIKTTGQMKMTTAQLQKFLLFETNPNGLYEMRSTTGYLDQFRIEHKRIGPGIYIVKIVNWNPLYIDMFALRKIMAAIQTGKLQPDYYNAAIYHGILNPIDSKIEYDSRKYSNTSYGKYIIVEDFNAYRITTYKIYPTTQEKIEEMM